MCRPPCWLRLAIIAAGHTVSVDTVVLERGSSPCSPRLRLRLEPLGFWQLEPPSLLTTSRRNGYLIRRRIPFVLRPRSLRTGSFALPTGFRRFMNRFQFRRIERELASIVSGVFTPVLANTRSHSRSSIASQSALAPIRKILSGFMNAWAAATYLVKRGVPSRLEHERIGKAVQLGLEKNCERRDLPLEELRSLSPHLTRTSTRR